MRKKLSIIGIIVWALGCLLVLSWCYKVAKFYKCENEDIFYTYREGNLILNHTNPYARIHQSDMAKNDKYATYVPGGYLISAGMQAAGLTKFSRWLRTWRKAMFFCHAAIALVLFGCVYDLTRSLVLCAFAVTIQLFNRWSLFVLYVSHLDTLALLLFMVGIYLQQKKPRFAFFFYGASLAIKQMGVFTVPILLIDAWFNVPRERRLTYTFQCVMLLLTIPLLVSAPFLFLDPAALIKSVLFSVTRDPSHHMIAPALLDSMGQVGTIARIPMFALLAALYLLCWFKRLPLIPALALQFLIFLYFSPVLFQQYILWEVPFLLLTLCGLVPYTRFIDKNATREATVPIA